MAKEREADRTGRLLLGRKEGERVLIDPDIVIEVHRVSEGKVRLGVIAPGRRVRRDELAVIDGVPADEPPREDAA